MNKSLFLSLAATALLASCSSDEVLESVEPQAISFENPFVDKGTRADVTDLADGTLSKLFVYGSYGDHSTMANPKLEFDNVEVAKEGTYTETKFWVTGKDYKFAAYSNGNSKIASESITYTENTGVMAIAYTNDGTKDLIYASAIAYPESVGYNTKVGLTFNHVLAKVNFKFTTNFSTGYEVKVSDLQILALPQQATFTTSEVTGVETAGNWGTFSAKAAMAYNTPITVLTSGGAASESRYVIPQANDGSDLKASFKVTITNTTSKVSTEKTFTPSLKTSANRWDQSYVYTYTAAITNDNMEYGKPIEFEVTKVNGWDDSTKPDTPLK